MIEQSELKNAGNYVYRHICPVNEKNSNYQINPSYKYRKMDYDNNENNNNNNNYQFQTIFCQDNLDYVKDENYCQCQENYGGNLCQTLDFTNSIQDPFVNDLLYRRFSVKNNKKDIENFFRKE